MRKIYIIACGGTIAGKAGSASDLTGYRAGAMTVGELLAALPGLAEEAAVEGEQFANMDSSDMTEGMWLALARRTEEIAARADVDGIVVTHGTDTLEETAYFLNLTVHTHKPVIITGAMRPATAVSADGPLNLWEAVRLAACAEAGKYGVLIAMNSTVCSARFGYKTDTTHVQAFHGRQLGVVGFMQNGDPYFYQAPLRLHTYASTLSVHVAALPPVWILYGHVGMSPRLVETAVASGVKGIILAGLGHGRNPDYMDAVLRIAADEGIFIVRTSRVLGGIVTEGADGEYCLCGDSLTPQQAKILLQLSLANGCGAAEIAANFGRY